MAVRRDDGKILWQRTVREELPHEGALHRKPCVPLAGDRRRTCVRVLRLLRSLLLDLDGKLLWETDLGRMHPLHGHGEGSSPALYRKTLIINWDHEGESFVVAFDKRTGKQRWKVHRDRGTSWTTPIVVEHSAERDKPQVIISGSERLRAYDLATGEVVWECGGLSAENVVSSPVAGHGLVFAGSTYDRQGERNLYCIAEEQ
ncbi:MAG: PQQ-binding-like beta-propeller repeat protein [Acidobacteriota bacterium]